MKFTVENPEPQVIALSPLSVLAGTGSTQLRTLRRESMPDGSTPAPVTRPPVDLPGHRMLMLDSESWMACLPRDHRLAERREVAITELLDCYVSTVFLEHFLGVATTGHALVHDRLAVGFQAGEHHS